MHALSSSVIETPKTSPAHAIPGRGRRGQRRGTALQAPADGSGCHAARGFGAAQAFPWPYRDVSAVLGSADCGYGQVHSVYASSPARRTVGEPMENPR